MGLMGRVWAEIGGDASELKKAAKEGEAALKKLAQNASNYASKASDAFEGFGGVLASVVTFAGVMKGVQYLAKATQESYKYADEVRNVSRVTGASAEESSRLLQVTGNLGIETNTLTSSLQTMVKKGYEPTIENLMKMSDQYKAIVDPMEKVLFLQNRFTQGQQSGGAGIAPLMELGSARIQAMSASISQSLILSNRQMYLSNLSAIQSRRIAGKVEGIKLGIGTEVSDMIYRATTSPDEKINDLKNYGEEIKRLGVTQEEYNGLMKDASYTMGLYMDVEKDLLAAPTGHGPNIKIKDFLATSYAASSSAKNLEDLSDAEIKEREETAKLDAETRASVAGILLKNSITSDGISLHEEYRDKMDDLIQQEKEYQDVVDEGNRKYWAETNKKLVAAKEGLEEVRDAQGKLTQQYKQQFGISSMNLISAGGKNMTSKDSLDLAYALNLTDEKTYGIQSAVYDIADAWDGATDGLIDFESWTSKEFESMGDLNDMAIQVTENSPKGGNATLYYNIMQTTYERTLPWGAGGGYTGPILNPNYGAGLGHMHGGVVYGGEHGMIVPPGFSNDGMPVMVSSGERLDVTPAGNKNTGDDELRTMIADLKFAIEGLPIYIRDAIQTL